MSVLRMLGKGRARSRANVRIAVVGAGVSGLAMGVRLKKAGFHNFTIYEQSDGPGGTWRDNTFPGCEVDIPSHAYSFSFFPYDWSQRYAPQRELLQYCEDVVHHFVLRPHCRFNTRVEQAIWDDAASLYRVKLGDGSEHDYDVVVSALGLLNYPRYPDWPGLESFEGIKFHSFDWDHDQDLRGKRIAVVGVGSTSAQVVPSLAPIAGELSVFQRQPGWVFPKDQRTFTPEERKRFRRFPILQKLERHKVFYRRQKPSRLKSVHRMETPGQAAVRKQLETWIASEVKDPDVARQLTPDYPVGCKRPVFANDFYQAFNLENVKLVPNAVARVTPTGIVDETGAEHEIDVLVMCTGFQPTRYLASLEISGRGGRTIHDIWRGTASAFLGLSVPGIPNFFMLYGPNTNGGVSIMSNAERQAGAVLRALRAMVRRNAKVVDTRPLALRWFVRWVDKGNAKRSSADPANCTSYFFSADGRNVTQWPTTTRVYTTMLATVWLMGLMVRSRA